MAGLYDKAVSLIEDEFNPTKINDELRTQPRIDISSEINIYIPALNITVSGKLTNISWGGAQIRTKHFLGKESEKLTLIIPYPHQEDVYIEGELIRYWEKKIIFIQLFVSRKCTIRMNLNLINCLMSYLTII